MKVSVFGLGKLGLCTAACFAWRGHTVIGTDVNAEHLGRLRRGECSIEETGLEEMLGQCGKNLRFTEDAEEAAAEAEVMLIIVPTPSAADGRFDNGCVEAVLRQVGSLLARREGFGVVDVVSTVMPGSCGGEFVPLLEGLSGLKCGVDFGLVYNPEFIAIGSVIRDFLNPDMVLIGASDERSAGMVRGLYESTCLSRPYVACMSLVNAEIAKLSLNCFVTMKISFANELAAICERVPGADVDAISGAIGRDTRVGAKYLRGGLGFGGPCFPRDNIAFQAFARGAGSEARIGPRVVEVNDGVVERVFKAVADHTAAGGRVAVLGLSYKPGTHIVEESQSVAAARRLAAAGYEVAVHDPRALGAAREALGGGVSYAEDAYAASAGADAVVLMTDWAEYRELDWGRIEEQARDDAVVVDCWRALRGVALGRMRYVGLGLGPAEEECARRRQTAAGVSKC